MKLVSYQDYRRGPARVGALIEVEDGTAVLDLQKAYAISLVQQDSQAADNAQDAQEIQYAQNTQYAHDTQTADPFAAEIAAVRIPGDMKKFLEGGSRSMHAARQGLALIGNARDANDAQRWRAQRVLLDRDTVRLLAPVARPGKIISVGGNYQSHVQEVRKQGVRVNVPDYPIAFLKMPSAVVGPDEPVLRSVLTEELDYEIELGLVIGRRCKNVPAQRWREVVAGITVINDISMRDIILQEAPFGIPFQGKNLDTSCPIGPCITTLDDIADPHNLEITLRVNGELRQRDNTRNMVFDFGAIVAYWSRVTLEPGDIITTGTTTGVAGFHKQRPDKLLKHGDVIEAEIQGIGVLRNTVVDERLHSA